MSGKTKFEEMVEKCYKEEYKNFSFEPKPGCLSDETMSSFAAEKCSQKETEKIREHIMGCDRWLLLLSRVFKKARSDEEAAGERICPQCGAGDKNQQRFCQNCGAEFSISPEGLCMFCERPIRNISKYCPHCGKKLFSEKVLTKEDINKVAELLPDDVQKKEAIVEKIAEVVRIKEETMK